MTERTYWHRQARGKPLFPDMLWSKPENKMHAGKLLVVGGNAQGFAAPARAYQESLRAGAGVVRVLLPDALQKTVGTHFESADFVPSTPSGSFARSSLLDMLQGVQWADGVLFSGELGRNSETAILLESFIEKTEAPLTLTRDVVDYFYHISERLLSREDTLLVVSMAQLQRLCTGAKFTTPITFAMSLLQLIDALHSLTNAYPVKIIVKHFETILVADGGKISTTKLAEDLPVWRLATASRASVWWLQHPQRSFEALTTSLAVD